MGKSKAGQSKLTGKRDINSQRGTGKRDVRAIAARPAANAAASGRRNSSARNVAKGNIRVRLGLRVQALRRRRGWGQPDLAAESGLDRSYISKIENGRIEIGLTTLEVLANSFGMTVSQFMRGV
jgi:ribosome-binding protein aMBF1 (putative translation factor)